MLTYRVPFDTATTHSFSGPNFIKSIKNKKITFFYLDGDHQLNEKKFNIIQLEALKLKFTCDTNQVIAIHLSDRIFYGEFIYLLNMMIKNDHKRYVGWKNFFYILSDGPCNPEDQ